MHREISELIRYQIMIPLVEASSVRTESQIRKSKIRAGKVSVSKFQWINDDVATRLLSKAELAPSICIRRGRRRSSGAADQKIAKTI